MIDFDLTGLHPSYERPVIDTLRGLQADYPMVAPLKVVLFEKAGDCSMGTSEDAGVIKLNKYRFSRPINEFREAARTDTHVHMVRNAPPILWHGDMEEPHHVLCHEFGHQLSNHIPQWREFAELHWRQSCADPVNCRPPSGYCLATPDEFFADSFSAMRLNYPCEAARLLREMLNRYCNLGVARA